MGIALLEFASHCAVIAYEISRLDEEINEIKPSGLGLDDPVSLDRDLQGVVEKRSEVGVTRRNDGVEIDLGSISES